MNGTRKLGRTSEHRNAMLRAMVTYLFENGKIETTVTRAKEVRSMAEKMVTLGKKEELHAKRQVYSYITKETVAKKGIDEYGPKYADRNGGYTRIVKIGPRRGDAAEMAIIELVCSQRLTAFSPPLFFREQGRLSFRRRDKQRAFGQYLQICAPLRSYSVGGAQKMPKNARSAVPLVKSMLICWCNHVRPGFAGAGIEKKNRSCFL